MAALLVLAVALLLLPALARGQAPLRHSASAFGHVLQTDFIGAGEAGPNGEDPVGSLTLSGFLNFQTQTTCLNLSGNAVVSGGRILTGRDAGKGFLSSSIDHGPPVNGKPVDVTVFSGLLPRPPRNCPSPGDAPPEQMRDTGGGPFTSGDLVVVDAIERLPAGSPTARVRVLGLGMGRPRGVLVATQTGPSVRVRVCGAPGVALLRLTQRTSPPGRKAPTWVRASWQDERRQDRPCQIHRVSSPVASSGVGRHRIRVRARTTGRRWSREAERTFDLGCWSLDGRRRRGASQRRCDIASKKATTMASPPKDAGRIAKPGRPQRASALENPPRKRATYPIASRKALPGPIRTPPCQSTAVCAFHLSDGSLDLRGCHEDAGGDHA